MFSSKYAKVSDFNDCGIANNCGTETCPESYVAICPNNETCGNCFVKCVKCDNGKKVFYSEQLSSSINNSDENSSVFTGGIDNNNPVNPPSTKNPPHTVNPANTEDIPNTSISGVSNPPTNLPTTSSVVPQFQTTPTTSSTYTPTTTTSNGGFFDQLQFKYGIPKGLFIGAACGIIVLILLLIIALILCCKKPKKSKKREERNLTDIHGYDKLRDENYSNYRSMTNSSFHANSSVVDPNPYAQIPNIEDIPTIDSILIENKRNISSPEVNNSKTNIYRNDMASLSQSSLVNNQSTMNGSEIFNKNNNYQNMADTSFSKRPMSNLGNADTSFSKRPMSNMGLSDTSFNKRPMSNMGSVEMQYNSPIDISKKTIDVQPLSATVTTADALYSNAVKNNNESWNYETNTKINNGYMSPRRNPNMSFTGNDDVHSSVNNSVHSYTPTSPNGIANNKYYQNNQNNTNGVTSNNLPNAQNGNNLYINTMKNKNQSMDPFSDSHATQTPTNGYAPDLTVNTNLKRQESRDSDNNENQKQNQSFSNISKNYSFKNDNNYISSPATPKSVHSLKSPTSKHQSLVTSPSSIRKNMKRATITSPVHESFNNMVNSISMETPHSGILKNPSTPKTPRSGTPNLSVNETRNNSIKSNYSPNIVRPSTPNGFTPNLERKSSNKSVHSNIMGTPGMSQLSNVGTPGMSQHSIIGTPGMSQSQYSVSDSPTLEHKISSITLENIPSGRQTLERHHSGKSKFSTATLERVPSNGKKLSDPIDKTDTTVMKANNLMVMSPTSYNKGSSAAKSPQPKSILKNANSVNSTKLSSISSSPDITKSQSLKRKKSKSRKSGINTNTNNSDINVPPFPSLSRKGSNSVIRGDNSSHVSSYENVPTTPLKPPQLTVFAHAVATPPTPKSTRFPQDVKVLPPTEKAVLIPPDILGGTEVVPLNTMTLQRKHFHKRNKSMNAASIVSEHNDYNVDHSVAKIKPNNDHPLPVPPIHHQRNKSNGDAVNGIDNQYKNSERVGRSRDKTYDNYGSHYRSKSLPRPNKYNRTNRYVDDASNYASVMESGIPQEIEQKLTSFEVEFCKERENQKAMHSRSKNSVLSILHEEKRNMDYYIAHCDD